MIRTLLTTTAVAMLMTAGVIAQDATTTAPANETAPAAGTEAPAANSTEMPADNSTEAPAATTGSDAAATTAPVESGAAEETDIDEPWDMSAGYVAVDTDNLGSELIDQPVYSSAGDDAEEIGNVTDIVFGEDGRITAVVIGVGGFLGIGEKSVAVPFDMLEFTLAADNTERWVVPTTADALTAAPEFVWEEDEPADANDAATDDAAVAPADGAAMAPADTTTMAPADTNTMAPAADATATDPAAAPATDTAAAPAANTTATTPMAMPREGYNTVEADALTADNLDGATVIGPDGNDIAEVGDILLTADGQVDALLVDFGGFLGLGQKTVAVGMENLEFAANEAGDLVIYTDFTREQLEAQPDYDEATYATTPAQRITDQ